MNRNAYINKTVKDVFGRNMWVGYTSGGWGNGPYNVEIKFDCEKPDERVLHETQDWRSADVTINWREGMLKDISKRKMVNALVGVGFRRERIVDYIIREYKLPCDLSDFSKNFRENLKRWRERKSLHLKLSKLGISVPKNF